MEGVLLDSSEDSIEEVVNTDESSQEHDFDSLEKEEDSSSIDIEDIPVHLKTPKPRVLKIVQEDRCFSDILLQN